MKKYKISSVTIKPSEPVFELPNGFVILAHHNSQEATGGPMLLKIVYLEPLVSPSKEG